MLYAAVVFAAWAAACWFSQPFDHPFLGLAVFDVDAAIPSIACLLSLAGASVFWLLRKKTEPLRKARAWILRNRIFVFGLAACLVVHILLQLPAIVMYQGANNGDSSQYGIAAYHIASGEIRPMHMLGKRHIGSFPHHLTALLNVSFGKSPAHLRIVNTLFYLGFIVLLAALVKRIADFKVALIAAALGAVAPNHVFHSTTYSEFPEMLFWGTAALLTAVRMTERDRPGFRQYFLLGFVAGMGLWAHPQFLSFLLAAMIALFLKDKLFIIRPQVSAAVPGFLTGGVVILVNSCFYREPYLESIVRADFDVGRMAGASVRFLQYIPAYLGLTFKETVELLFHPLLVAAVIAIAAACLAVYFHDAREELGQAFRLRNFGVRKLMPGLLLLSVFLVFVGSSPIRSVDSVRYIFPIWPAIVVIIALAAAVLMRKRKVIGWAVLVAVLTVFLMSTCIDILNITEREGYHRRWVEFCRSKGITRFYGPWIRTYWTTFVTAEEIIGANYPFEWEPYLEYQRIVGESERPPAFLFAGKTSRQEEFERILERLDISCRKTELEIGRVFFDLSKRLTFAQLYGLKDGRYEAEISAWETHKISGFGRKSGLYLVEVTARNSGEISWIPNGENGHVECVAIDSSGLELRRSVLYREVAPGETCAWRFLLDAGSPPGGKFTIDVRVNDVPMTKGALLLEPGEEEGGSNPIRVSKLNPVRLGGERHNLLSEDYMFLEGWGERTENGIWSEGGFSRIGFVLRDSRGLVMNARLRPFESRFMPKGEHNVEFLLNGQPLGRIADLRSPQKILLNLPESGLRPGLNVIELKYGVIEPYMWRARGGLNFRYHRRAIGLIHLRIRNANESED